MQISKRRSTSGIPQFSRASSEGGERIQRRLAQAVRDIQTAQRWVAVSEVMELFVACGREGWDGDEARPVTVDVYVAARRFLATLPTAFPNPEVSAGADGEIGLDWFPGPRSNFSVLVLGSGKVIYAGATPDRHFSGIVRFDDVVPSAILDELRRLF